MRSARIPRTRRRQVLVVLHHADRSGIGVNCRRRSLIDRSGVVETHQARISDRRRAFDVADHPFRKQAPRSTSHSGIPRRAFVQCAFALQDLSRPGGRLEPTPPGDADSSQVSFPHRPRSPPGCLERARSFRYHRVRNESDASTRRTASRSHPTALAMMFVASIESAQTQASAAMTKAISNFLVGVYFMVDI